MTTLPRNLPNFGPFDPPTFNAKALLRVFGTDCTLDDGTIIRIIIKPVVNKNPAKALEIPEHIGYIPNDATYTKGLAVQKEITTRRGEVYYVQEFQRLDNGWLEVPLQYKSGG